MASFTDFLLRLETELKEKRAGIGESMLSGKMSSHEAYREAVGRASELKDLASRLRELAAKYLEGDDDE